ncbi:MAG: ABC transporter permease [Acidobacteria bacterium]|nr:MAG: ABC transporter permease [Acidobacteriota bacterium]
MTILAAVRIAFDALRANPLRTLLSTLGIVMGAGALAAVLALGDGIERVARERLEEEGMQTVSVGSRTFEMLDGIRVPREDYPTLSVADADELLGRLGASNGASLILQGAGIASLQRASRGVVVIGVMTTRAQVPGPAIAEGRALTDAETRGTGRLAVVSARLAEALGAATPKDALGRSFELGKGSWVIVGVLQARRGMRELTATVPIAAAVEAMTPSGAPRLPMLFANGTRVEEMVGLRSQVDAWVASRGWKGKVDVASRGPERLRQMADGILVFKILMGAITAISLLVGGIGIMNVLLASVAERTREIGIRKATGATRRAIVAQFLTESVVISIAGSLVGVTLGLAGAIAVTAIMRARTEIVVYAPVTWPTLAVSILAAALVGLVFGTYPALRAARLSPVDAIMRE